MDDRPDPISQFFPDIDPDSVDLYAVLTLTNAATPDQVKKAYRKLALIHHPDKHATTDDDAKAATALKFQQIGFAYTILSDEKKRERYDKTGRTDEGFDLGAGEDGWEAYFEDLFERVTKEKLDELKKEYQGSQEEVDDLKKAYVEFDGSIDNIMQHIPHSTFDDEARFIVTLSGLVESGELSKSKTWERSIQDEKAKLVRKKQSAKEAGEAEALAKELGVWDEFYGGGKPSSKRGKDRAKGKGKGKDRQEDGEDDTSALQALILKKRKNMDSFFDGLAAKYAEPEEKKDKGKGKKRGKKDDGDDEDEEHASPRKKSCGKNVPPPPDIDDEEFEKLQQKLFGDKTKPPSQGEAVASSAKGKRAARGKRNK